MTKAPLSVRQWIGIDLGMDKRQLDAFWKRLERVCLRAAKEQGMPDSLPCLIIKNGGYAYTTYTQ
jgi:hypothetical protein